ncbi:MAG: uroporphyrinogen-III C-methyltransferase [Candidatus Omnitrophica bacterium]|nr:uroporphyrinogen-III C-methyltransferase [Candidatus Omnitrophota bacterium]
MQSRKVGKVYLVGAGPGDAGLITVRGKNLLETADCVVYDHLIHPALLQLATRAKKKIYAGKRGLSNHQIKQSTIEQLLTRLARQGKTVVRLKGGDPFIFGRGGEEALALKKNRIPFEIVPGVTAGFAAPAYAGIPVTQRGVASDVTFVTAHDDPSKPDPSVDWRALARLKGTLVIYMGLHTLEKVSQFLIRYGKSPRTPAAVIEQGTTGRQQLVLATLETVACEVKRALVKPPAVVVVGDVVPLHRSLAWFEEKALFGKKVMVTRASSQASTLREKLEDLGASVIEFPTIEVHPVKDWTRFDRAIRDVSRYDFLVLTSENGVLSFVRRLCALKRDVRDLKNVRIIAIGSGTEKRLSEFGLRADFIPPVFSSEGLIRSLQAKHWIKGKQFLLLRTNIAPEYLKKCLQTNGGQVTEISVYETKKPKYDQTFLRKVRGEKLDFITFTSASTAQNFFKLFSKNWREWNAHLVSIGPVTSQTIRACGGRVWREAKPHTIDGLIHALLQGTKRK